MRFSFFRNTGGSKTQKRKALDAKRDAAWTDRTGLLLTKERQHALKEALLTKESIK